MKQKLSPGIPTKTTCSSKQLKYDINDEYIESSFLSNITASKIVK